jgi:amino-acid N-acetyltransferase
MVEPAQAPDLPAVVALLAASGLPAGDLTEAHLAHFVVVRDDARLAAVAGLEVYPGGGLLRSVAVDHRQRGRGLGAEVVAAIERRAEELGLPALYLLTTTAAEYFAAAGWQRIDREEVPPDVRASPEFAGICPSTAACFRKEVS